MYNTSLRIVKDSAEAEDVMQESFLSAFTKLHTFKGEVTFGSWLKRIVINNSIYHYRKQLSLTLHLIEGYDYEEISKIMDISYANCRTIISRAKQSLRNKLTIAY